MINVRQNVFETNSSSMHSICIAKQNNYDIPSTLHFGFGEFGWENRILYSTEAKASYLYTALLDFVDSDHKDEFEDYKNYIYKTLGDNGCDCDFADVHYDKYGWCDDGYIDHGYELREWIYMLRHSPKKLLRFLFSPDSFIITGNDNGDTYYETVAETDFSNVEKYVKGN